MDPESLEHVRKMINEFYNFAQFSPTKAREYEDDDSAFIDKGNHAQFTFECMLGLGAGYQSVDSGQPWIPYWLTTAQHILDQPIDELPKSILSKIIKYLRLLHNEVEGGFRGAKIFCSHIASSYAGVLAIVNIGSEEAYKVIDPVLMRKFLKSMFNNGTTLEQENTDISSSKLFVAEPGSYIMHENGEYDLRGWYCALVVADILGLLPDEDLTRGMGDLIQKCQTYEGGIACSPYGEAHAGYTYWGLAWMILLDQTDKLNMDRLIEWATARQLEIEGGFNGRINKLVDSWYNFWIGATIEMIDIVLKGEGNVNNGEWLCNQLALQGYTLFWWQSSHGGLKDKPGKHIDIYHTMYSLAGLSIAQHKR